MFDGGLFLLLLAVGLIFLIPKFSPMFRLVSVIIFFALGTVLLAGEDVGFVTQSQELSPTTGNAVDIESTWLMIGDGDASTFNDNSQWVGWVLIAVAMMTSFRFLATTFGGNL